MGREEKAAAQREAVVGELEVGGELVLLPKMDERQAAIDRLRPRWWRRALDWLRDRFRRGDVETVGMGRMPRAKHREMIAFARESGNGAMLECLKRQK
jgi:hypothetical protein